MPDDRSRAVRASLTRRAAAAWLAAAVLPCAAESARADVAPNAAAGPVKVVIAFPPGGTSTASMRPLVAPLGRALEAPIELDYRPGAGGNVAAIHVAKAAPDGHTLLFGHAGPLAINHHITVERFFEPERDLVPLAMVVRYPIILCVHARHGVTTLDGFRTLAASRRLVVGSSGNGSIQHLAGAFFNSRCGLEMLHLPFAGGGPLQDALKRGALDVLFETGSNVRAHIAGGTLVPLGVMARERLAMLPQVPTFAELGLPDFEVSAWFGLLAPAGTPAATADRVTRATLDALADPAVDRELAAVGGLAWPLGPQAFAGVIAAESRRWGDVIRGAEIAPLGTGIDMRLGQPR